MSLLGLPIPVSGLYAKNNLNDALRHRAVSTVCDWEPERIITGTDWWAQRWMDEHRDGWTGTEPACFSYGKFQHYISASVIVDSSRFYKARLGLLLFVSHEFFLNRDLSHSLTPCQFEPCGQRVQLTLSTQCNELKAKPVCLNCGRALKNSQQKSLEMYRKLLKFSFVCRDIRHS